MAARAKQEKPKSERIDTVPDQFKFSTYEGDIDLEALKAEEREDAKRDAEAGYVSLRDKEGNPMGRRRMKREQMMMADRADVFNAKELKYVQDSAHLSNAEVVEAISAKDECASLMMYRYVVLNIISGGQAPTTQDGDVQFRVLYMARTKSLADAAKEMIETWTNSEGEGFPGTPLVYPVSRLVPGMHTLDEQVRGAEKLHEHCNRTLEAWRVFHKAKVDLTELNRDGIIAPRTMMGVFKPFDMGIVRESAKREEEAVAEEEGGAEETKDDKGGVEGEEEEKEACITCGAVAVNMTCPGCRPIQDSVIALEGDRDGDNVDEGDEDDLSLAEIKRRAFLGSVARDLAEALDDLDPDAVVPPNAHVLFTVLPDCLSHPDLKTKTWQDKASKLGREREEPFVLPDPAFEDEFRRPFFRVFPILVNGDARETMDGAIAALQSVIHDTRVFRARYRKYKSVVEFCVPRKGWMWRDKDINEHMHKTYEGREELQDSWKVMTSDLGYDPRGLSMSQTKGKKGEVKQHVVREVRDDGWIGPSGKMPKYMRRRVKKSPYLDEPLLKGGILDHAKNERGDVDIESRGYVTGKLRKKLRRQKRRGATA